MPAIISSEVIECYLKCRYKATLRLIGETGQRSAFELFERECKATALARARQAFAMVSVENVSLSSTVLRQGAALILGAHLDNSEVSIQFDALQRVNGSSQIGDFHYQPVLIVSQEKITTEQKLLLGVQALVLETLQGRRPMTGIVIHGRDGKRSRVTLPLARAQAILERIRGLESAPPKMVLNQHCQVCEFQARCHAQAQNDDDLSLLRGLGEKEIKNYNRRGIFTLTQLSCAFRPRRGKNRKAKPRHDPALQAMAIREKRVLVLGSPQVPDSPVRIYLDLEGDPDRDFVYLLGMIVELYFP
jgi:predicted RecB family nuclease